MFEERRKLPVGLQSFETIRRDGFVYVDKTDLVWNLVNRGNKFTYLSRPRRFGKSLLVDTLACYLSGRKELFNGLKIMQLETEWSAHPVIRLDMSRGGATAAELRLYLNKAFKQYEKQLGIATDENDSLANRFDEIICTAREQTGQRVVILIDEYDSPLQHSWKTPHHEECTAIYRSVFAILKADEEQEYFVFITGITKFTQVSLFSVLNNLSNVSFAPAFAPICGITETEINDCFQPELQQMADRNRWTIDETRQRLKDHYDGYHFSEDNLVDVYNPFSLVNSLNERKICNYWAASGATSLLTKFLKNAELNLDRFDNCSVLHDILEMSDVSCGSEPLFLYQTGYLTIKRADEFGYILGYPNNEVRQSLYQVVLPALAMRAENEVFSIQSDLYRQLGTGNVADAMASLKSLVADVPYSNKKLQSMDMEERYRLIVSTLLRAVGYRVEVEHMLSTGRIDIVAWTPKYIYVFELKLANNGGVAAAAAQMCSKDYLAPFQSDPRTTVGIALELDELGKGVLGWKIVEY